LEADLAVERLRHPDHDLSDSFFGEEHAQVLLQMLCGHHLQGTSEEAAVIRGRDAGMDLADIEGSYPSP
jgi:hypothetical protein